MNTVHPYADYAVARETAGSVCYHESALYPQMTLRCFYRIVRIPSTKTIIVYTFADAADEERKWVEEAVKSGEIKKMFRSWEREGITFRRRSKDGTYRFSATGGTALDDPLIDLELEMMRDRDEQLLTIEQVADRFPDITVDALYRIGWMTRSDGTMVWSSVLILGHLHARAVLA